MPVDYLMTGHSLPSRWAHCGLALAAEKGDDETPEPLARHGRSGGAEAADVTACHGPLLTALARGPVWRSAPLVTTEASIAGRAPLCQCSTTARAPFCQKSDRTYRGDGERDGEAPWPHLNVSGRTAGQWINCHAIANAAAWSNVSSRHMIRHPATTPARTQRLRAQRPASAR